MTLRAKLVFLFATATLLPLTLGAGAWFLLGRQTDAAAPQQQVRAQFESELANTRQSVLQGLANAPNQEVAAAKVRRGKLVDFAWWIDAQTMEILSTAHRHRVLGHDGHGLVNAAQHANDKPFVIKLGDGEHQKVLASATLEENDSLRRWVVVGHRASRLSNVDALLMRHEPARGPTLWSWLLMVVLIAIALSLLAANRVTKWLRQSLQEVAEAAQRIGQGDLHATVPERGDASFMATATAFNRMTLQLREAQTRLRTTERIAAWQDIAKRLAHEIKNPLSPIKLSIETLKKAKDQQHADFDAIFDESTTAILEEVARLQHIVSEFGRFAQLPAPRPSQVHLGEWTRQIAGLYEPTKVLVQIDNADQTQTLCDREQIAQVLHNLIRNALDANDAHGSTRPVEVRVSASTEEVTISVADHGPGVADAVAANIFEPHFTTKAHGSGLGLAITKRIVDEHRGSIRFQSRETGTTFSVSLPKRSASETIPGRPILQSPGTRMP